MAKTIKKATGTLKFTLSLALCILFRMASIPLPNIEPVMTFILPLSKKYGKHLAFLFGATSIIALDLVMNRAGLWTIYTALAYGAIGAAATSFFKKPKTSRARYVGLALTGTLFYDAVTAYFFGLQFNQPLLVTIMGQIPFTFYHLIGNIALVGLFSPLVEKHVMNNPALNLDLHKTIQKTHLFLTSRF
ncbi:MAG: hypothetical protein ACE5DI_04620 [Candidatus Micrarchaeia archaeon]